MTRTPPPLPGRFQAIARDQRGFALLAVTLVLAILGVVVTEFAYSMRLQANMVRAYKDRLLGQHLAEAGVQQAIREIMTEATVHGIDEDGQVVFYRLLAGTTVPQRVPPLERTRVPLGAGEFSYRITDEERRVNLNVSQPDRIDKLLLAIGIDKDVRDKISDSLLDWRDADDNYRTNGAESDDYYLNLPVPYRARNGNLQDVAELLQIKGVTPEIYYGTGERPGLAQLVTVRGSGAINANTAPPPVLSAAGLSEAEIALVVETRVNNPKTGQQLSQLPRGATRFTVLSTVFRIEAEGLIAGQPKARVIAIVQRGGSRGSVPTATMYSWRPVPLRAEPAPAQKAGASR